MGKFDMNIKASYIWNDEEMESVKLETLEDACDAYATGAIRVVVNDVEVFDEDGDPVDDDIREEIKNGIQKMFSGEEAE